MNIFVLDNNVKKCAQYHCDKHVIKMILESAQMLCSAISICNNVETPYRPTHVNHPCSKWVRESKSNWIWLSSLAKELNAEYRIRYCKNVNHKSYDVIKNLPEPNIEDIGLTEFKLAMPDEYKIQGDPISSYRKYYRVAKANILSYKNNSIPPFLKEVK